MANGHGGARTGAGRPPMEIHDAPDTVLRAQWVWIEGHMKISEVDDERRLIRDRLAPLLSAGGFTMHTTYREPWQDKPPRQRSWAHHRVNRRADVILMVKLQPGLKVAELAKALYKAGDAWTDADQLAALHKTRMWLVKLVKEDHVHRRYNAMGRSTIYPGPAPQEQDLKSSG